MVKVQISLLTPKHETELLKVYEKIYSSREEVKTFYGGFIQNGWISGAWKNGELIGVLTWAPREAVKHGLAEIIDFWVRADERKKGIGGKLIDHALLQIQRYYERFGATLKKVMLFTATSSRYLAARTLYEKKEFQIVATIPKNALDNLYSDELLYVLEIAT